MEFLFDEKIYIGNNHSLASWDDSTATDAVLTLSEDAIISLGKDTASGDMLIGTNSSFNAAGSRKQISKIFVWDGFSPVPNREIIVEDRVTSFYNLNGITYVFYGTNLGYWNGQGITHLRRLNIAYDSDNLIYSGKVTDLDGTLYIADGENVLAYGPIVQGGKKVFYYPFLPEAGKTIRGIVSVGVKTDRPYIAVYWGDSSGAQTLKVFNPYDNVAGSSSKFYTNKTYLPSNARINRVELIKEKLTTGDAIDIQVYTSLDDSFTTIGSMSFVSDGAVAQKTIGKSKNIETAVIQLRIDLSSGTETGIKQVKIHYDLIEKEL